MTVTSSAEPLTWPAPEQWQGYPSGRSVPPWRDQVFTRLWICGGSAVEARVDGWGGGAVEDRVDCVLEARSETRGCERLRMGADRDAVQSAFVERLERLGEDLRLVAGRVVEHAGRA